MFACASVLRFLAKTREQLNSSVNKIPPKDHYLDLEGFEILIQDQQRKYLGPVAVEGGQLTG